MTIEGMAHLRELKENEIISALREKSKPYQSGYLAMYSSWFDGVTRDPSLMLLPIDDHMVHRGDGVFEAFKSVNRCVYLLKDHLIRLERSAKAIDLHLPKSISEIQDLIVGISKLVNEPNCLYRLFVSRGPGGFSTNPYESVGAQIYLLVLEFKGLKPEIYQVGARAARSQVPIKDSWLAQIKSCNYLPNVLMKKEAVDLGVDLTISVDRNGRIGEGSTENVMVVDKDKVLAYPPLNTILRGTTMLRLAHLAEQLVKEGILKGIECREIHNHELNHCHEMFAVGTTLDVLPLVELDGSPIGNGQVGPVAQACLQLLRQDMQAGSMSLSY